MNIHANGCACTNKHNIKIRASAMASEIIEPMDPCSQYFSSMPSIHSSSPLQGIANILISYFPLPFSRHSIVAVSGNVDLNGL